MVLLCLFSAAAGLCFSLLNFSSLIKPNLGATSLQGFALSLDQINDLLINMCPLEGGFHGDLITIALI